MYGWPTVVASYQLYMLCNGTSSREISDTVQEVNRLISGCIKKKEWDVDYSTLLGSRLPLPTDWPPKNKSWH